MTRDMASRMVQDGTVPETAEDLDAWIANTPEAREVLERDGYGTNFTAHDLFPLLQIFVVQAGGQVASVAEEPAPSSKKWWLVGFLVVLFVVLFFALINASPRSM